MSNKNSNSLKIQYFQYKCQILNLYFKIVVKRPLNKNIVCKQSSLWYWHSTGHCSKKDDLNLYLQLLYQHSVWMPCTNLPQSSHFLRFSLEHLGHFWLAELTQHPANQWSPYNLNPPLHHSISTESRVFKVKLFLC